MTDMDKYTELLNKWSVAHDIVHNNMTQYIQISITVPRAEYRTNVFGSGSGFETTVEFDGEGNFVNIGIWE